MTVSMEMGKQLDVIAFLGYRPERSNLKKLENLNLPQLLKDGLYIPVLQNVWTQFDQPRRLQWLREQPQIHAPLLAERAIEEFIANPTVNTVIEIALPLIKAAEFRVRQDAVGVIDDSFASAYRDLQAIYLPKLDTLCGKNLDMSLYDIISANAQKLQEFVEKKIDEIVSLTFTEQLPSSQ